jgi:hypothetical protein
MTTSPSHSAAARTSGTAGKADKVGSSARPSPSKKVVPGSQKRTTAKRIGHSAKAPADVAMEHDFENEETDAAQAKEAAKGRAYPADHRDE